MKKSLALLGTVCLFAAAQAIANSPQIPGQAPGAKVQLKPGATITKAPTVLRVTINGTIREKLCEDYEVLVVTGAGKRYRVFPVQGSIAGVPTPTNADVLRQCGAHLNAGQRVTVTGVHSVINGNQDALSKAAIR